MNYLPSKIPLREALALAVKNTGAALESVKQQFRQALLLGDIRSEGRIWQRGSSRGWDWTPLESIPRSFFDDNKCADDCLWLACIFGGYEKIPEPLRGKEPYLGPDGTQQVDAAGNPIFVWTVTQEGQRVLGALRRPDFEKNSTGEVGNPTSFDRIARDIYVPREDVEKAFPPQAVDPASASHRTRRAKWKAAAQRHLEWLASSEPGSFPVTAVGAAEEIRRALGLGDGDTPSRKTIENWIAKDEVLEVARRKAEQSRRLGGPGR